MTSRKLTQLARSHEYTQAGFTFIELIISLMILGLILSFLPGTLRFSQRIWETDQAFDDQAALDAFRRFVEQRLTEAMPIHFRAPGRDVQIEFIGRSDHLAFVAPAAAGPAGGGVYRFELSNADGDPYPVTLSQSIYRLPGTTDREVSTVKTFHRPRGGVRSIAFRYFGAASSDQPKGWVAEWRRADALPDLVEISILVKDSRSVQRKLMVVPLRLRPG